MEIKAHTELLTPAKVLKLLRPSMHTPMYEAVAQWIEQNTPDGQGLRTQVINRGEEQMPLLVIEDLDGLYPQTHLIAGYSYQTLIQQIHSLILTPTVRQRVLNQISDEREAQLKKWGVQRHNRFIWSAILSEENGEVAQAALAGPLTAEQCEDPEALKTELVQTAAVAVAWLEHLNEEA
jgi:hypothetical protein